MRSFFILTFDSRPNDREVACKYQMAQGDQEFDSATFRRCQPFVGPFPDYVKLWVRPGSRTDLMGEPLSWPLLSDRLFELFKDFARDDIQEIAPPLFYIDSKQPVAGYTLMNVLRSLKTIDMEKSVTSEMNILGTQFTNVIKPVFRNEAIPASVHVFRPVESMSHVVISEELAQAMTGKVVGVALIRTQTI